MAILIQLLLAILPTLLKWLVDLLGKGKQLSASQADQLNHALYQFHQIEDAACKVGCTMGGTPPPTGVKASSVWPTDFTVAVLAFLLSFGVGMASEPQAAWAWAKALPQSTLPPMALPQCTLPEGKACHCSDQCTCGCNSGQPCRCGSFAAPPEPARRELRPLAPVFRSYAPVQFRGGSGC